MTTQVQFVDLRAQHEEIRAEIEAEFAEIIDRSSFIGGSVVASFEREFASYLGVSEVVGVANGTDALWLALTALGIGKGDGVVTVPNTFIATVEAITRTGAQPIFVDVDLDTATMDLAALRRMLEGDCRREDNGGVVHLKTGLHVAAALPVHLYGLPVDIETLSDIASRFGISVVEDACQAHGAEYRVGGQWKRAGSTGAAAGFSFYPAKNLGAMGDGGAVATNDAELAAKIRHLRDHGQSERYIHVTANGWNSRLDSLQAAVLRVKLARLERWNAKRREAAAQYRDALSGLPLKLPVEPQYARHVYHLFVARSEARDRLREGLSAKGIGTGLHYPIPLHLQQAYRHLGLGPGSFPNAERSAATGLSLPMHQSLTRAQIDQVAAACREILVVAPS
ncbi:MAG: DegT/DnrJ/EryC1/StrS family aminotransferase [Anaerolineales bacterium]